MIVRSQQESALASLFKGKAFIIYGPRQSGKTTFSEQLLEIVARKTLRLNGDDAHTREAFLQPNATLIGRIIGDHEIVFIDEAQRVQDVGVVIKISRSVQALSSDCNRLFLFRAGR